MAFLLRLCSVTQRPLRWNCHWMTTLPVGRNAAPGAYESADLALQSPAGEAELHDGALGRHRGRVDAPDATSLVEVLPYSSSASTLTFTGP